MTTTITGTTGVSQCQAGSVGIGDIQASVIVGTTTQSGGLPTGSIIERGSNANGEYVKYADGTMICTFAQTITLNINTAYNTVFFALPSWTYPVAFASNPIASLGAQRTGGVLSTGSGSASTTVASLYVIDYTSTTGQSITLRWFAIGRWF